MFETRRFAGDGIPVFSFLLVTTTCLLACAAPPQPNDPPAPAGTEVVDADGALLGRVDFPTSCDASVQGRLEHGLALLHHMNYTKAKPLFEEAATSDPECAIAYWGIAMTYVHPLWPDTVAGPRFAEAAEIVARGKAASRSSEREAGYLAAIGAYFEDEERTEWDRLAATLEAWRMVHENHPDDIEAAAFHALLLLGNAPAEDKTYARQIEASGILEGVLDRLPKHPGAHHYTIHAHDFPPLAQDALEIARRYDDLAPENTHALHMTSHIFTRLGLWPESIEFNIRAADAASERTAAGTVSLHHLHALDYLAYAYLQQADDLAALEVITGLKALEPPFQDHAATAYAFAAIPVRMAIERHDWDQAANIEPGWPAAVSWQKYPQYEAMSHFAMALGSAKTGQFDRAKTALAELQRLEDATAALDIAYDWATQVRIQRLAAAGWLAFESEDVDGGLALAREAAELEQTTEKNPVTPGEVLPAGELYGDMLRATGSHNAALDAYRVVLDRSPNRFNSLFGAGQSALEAGDTEAARSFFEQLIEICETASGEHPKLEQARAFLANSSARDDA